MSTQGGISGVAVGMATGGAFLLWIGIQGVDIRTGLKAVAGGKLPQGKPRSTGAVEAAEASIIAGVNAGQAGAAAGATGAGLAGTAAAGVAGGARSKLVAAARKYLGVPYRLAGTSRSGIDCSGLVVRAFQDAYGVTPPRTTYTQVAWRQLRPVKSGMVAGDLCFWPRVGPPGHVGIATGPGTVIHAPRPGQVVKEVPVKHAYTGGAMPAVYRYVGGKG